MMHECVHCFNVAAGKDGAHFNYFIHCWVAYNNVVLII